MRSTLRIAALLLALAGCESAATPLPAALIPTPSPLSATAVPSLHYAFSPEAFAYWGSELPAGAVQFQPGIDDLAQVDIAVAFGNPPGMSSTPAALVVGLRLNAESPPLDDSQVADLVVQAFQPQVIAAALADLGAVPAISAAADEAASPGSLRTALANAGYPDRLPLTLTAHLPGAERLPQIVQPYGIDLRLVEPSAASSRSLVHGEITAGTAQPSGNGWIALLRIPISIRVREGLNVRYDDSGLPRIGE
ncbi:MAG: hypothetical protein L6Q98_10900 [Anaerolineae bacterium]|nr:hypothetical protein [Anaerolineae bacterium]NUQ02666.1 hypothetical protein [Anaerolineae bacterium]